LSLPAITRKTDKGLPKYLDAEESDVYVLSGVEDLVPVLETDGGRFEDNTSAPGYLIHRYRPRIEGLFARIERWTKIATGEIHWRSISRDNVTTLYGRDNESRIVDPADPSPATPTRVFSWLICASYDDKGNAVVYEYAAENDDNVDRAQANERNRMRTPNRYLKRIKYGNRAPNRDLDTWQTKDPSLLPDEAWMFEVVFDYDQAHYEDVDPDSSLPSDHVRASSVAGGPWAVRPDPFSSHRAGFEVRTYRRCRRVLMYHHISDLPRGEKGYDGLVRSTEFDYADLDYDQPVGIEVELAHPGSTRFASFIRAVTQSGYVRDDSYPVLVRNGARYATYAKKSFPPLEFEYSKAAIQDHVLELDAESLENLPAGVDGATYQWVDLDGEGVSGILTEQAKAWLYKPNLGDGLLGPVQTVAATPSLAALSEGRQQLLDLAGDGQLDLVTLDGPAPGFSKRTLDEDWAPFRTFRQLPNISWHDPNLRFVDLDGDGHADVLITEQDVFTWHPSLAEEGFGPGRSVRQPLDEERGPRLLFADGSQSVYLADMCGDGLTDLVRIRNGEVCYWPNLGYGRFGAKVTMDNGPWLDNPEQFDQRRVRLTDIDGSGTTDLIYLARDGVRLYFNQSGNRMSEARRLSQFPGVDSLSSVMTADLLGNGTACLVWSSPLPGNARRPLRYIDLMGGVKPHLLIKLVNNLGAETRVHYASSTTFYLADKRNGRPWVTRLPFPVHVVKRVETFDHISRNRFVTRYAYHHGYFDGIEREFRGFGMVERRDTEEFAALSADGQPSTSTNIDASSHVPPILTKTWFHTGGYVGRGHVSNFFAGLLGADDLGEYYREPGLTEAEARELLLDDSVLPEGLTLKEEIEACRALKGSMLRQEVYALDGAGTQDYVNGHPYTVTEQNFTIRRLQQRGDNRHGVFFTHARELINYHYEREPADPRIQHALTLEVDVYGNVLKEAAIGYGRRRTIRVVDARGRAQRTPNPGLAVLTPGDQAKQVTALLTYTESLVTNSIESADVHRTPLPSDAITFELTGYVPTGPAGRFQAVDLVEPDPNAVGRLRHKFTDEVAYEDAATANPCRRPIECRRTLYRRDDLTSLLPLGEQHPLGLPGESYRLAFTPGLLAQIFERPHKGQPDEPLLPSPATVLGGTLGDQGGYVDLDADGHWWVPSGRAFFSTGSSDSAATELLRAREHFFLPRRYRDPFGKDTVVGFDPNDLLLVETRDALGNSVSVEANDYRVLQPRLVSDPNGNQAEVSFDTIGLVVGTAVMGKPAPATLEGDSLTGFVADPTQDQLDAFFDAVDPHTTAPALLQSATTRIVYDLDRFRDTQLANPDDPTRWQPVCAATLARETHVNAPLPPQGLKIQLAFSYSDGYGREIQKKIQAEPGPLVDGDPTTSPRWVGSGWTIFNNKGKPVRQYEPFFSATHNFEFGVTAGVSPVLFYDPTERVIVTLHPNRTFEKVVFDPWQQTTYDVNDTCFRRGNQSGDPRTDADIDGYVAAYFATQPAGWQTWHAHRIGGELGKHEQAAATRAAAHADTPTTAHLDALGRPFLTVVRNRVVCAGHDLDGIEDSFATRVELDIEGNHRAVLDERKLPVNALPTGALEQRIVMRYAYDMLGNRIHQLSMEAGGRWMLNDVAGKPIRVWDSRGHDFSTAYDALRRPVEQYVRGTTDESDPRTRNPPNAGGLLIDKIEYGEPAADASPADLDRAQKLNLRTRIYRHFDSAGIATNARVDANDVPTEAYDFKGNLLRSTRSLTALFDEIPDWSTNPRPQVDSERFEASTRYDALNRPVQSVAPHSDVPRGTPPRVRLNITQPVFNEANLLERVDVWLERVVEPAALLDPAVEAPSPVGVANIEYDAKGQRTLIGYKTQDASVVRTTYAYDRETYRLVHLYTRRGVDPLTAQGVAFTEDCENAQPPPPTVASPARPPQDKSCGLQNLHYTYDPVGNITHIQDDAQQTIFFRNRRVEPSNDYTYDAIYRLIEAKGREHLGQAGAPISHSYNDAGRVGILSADLPGTFAPNDVSAMGAYTEHYVYDAVGNFLQIQHSRTDAAAPNWTRRYAYTEASLIEPGKQSNCLSSTRVGNGPVEPYSHDAHGNMLSMPQLPEMRWDFKGRLLLTRRQRVNNSDADGIAHEGERTYYVYDASGQRVRKVTVLETGALKDERIYLGCSEVFRKYRQAPTANTLTLERETLHVMHDEQRIALVETRTVDTMGTDQAPPRLIRYQFGNHLGSATLELDDQALIISYEEYAPFGSTTYQAVRSQTETPKRYRYTGKERDEESGLYYHDARYFSPQLGRWLTPDPAGLIDGLSLYSYCRCNPVLMTDRAGTQAEAEVKAKPNQLNGIGNPQSVPGDVGKQTPRIPAADKPWARLSKRPDLLPQPGQSATADQLLEDVKDLGIVVLGKTDVPPGQAAYYDPRFNWIVLPMDEFKASTHTEAVMTTIVHELEHAKQASWLALRSDDPFERQRLMDESVLMMSEDEYVQYRISDEASAEAVARTVSVEIYETETGKVLSDEEKITIVTAATKKFVDDSLSFYKEQATTKYRDLQEEQRLRNSVGPLEKPEIGPGDFVPSSLGIGRS
jgi:RHS repeat-associated protein